MPAFNEGHAIEASCQSAITTLEALGVPYEVIVVDDGSTDDTREKAISQGVRVISHPANAGYGRALKTGILASQYDTIVISDADGTYPIERLDELLTVYDQGFCMVIAQREGAAYRESALKAPLRLILRILVEFVSGESVPDVNSGLRTFSRSEILPYYPHLCDTFSFTSSLTLSYLMSGRFVKFIPMPYGDRIGKTKVRLLRDSLRSLQYVFQQAIYYNPLKIFFTLAALCFGMSLLFITIGVAFQIKIAFQLTIGTFLVSMLITAMGILGELLKQIMEQGLPSNRSSLPVAYTNGSTQQQPVQETGHSGKRERIA